MCVLDRANALRATMRNTPPPREAGAHSKTETHSNLNGNISPMLLWISLDGYDSHESATIDAVCLPYNGFCASTLYKVESQQSLLLDSLYSPKLVLKISTNLSNRVSACTQLHRSSQSNCLQPPQNTTSAVIFWWGTINKYERINRIRKREGEIY